MKPARRNYHASDLCDVGSSNEPRRPRYALALPSLQIHNWNLLMGTTVTFKRPDEQILQGYLAEPEHAASAAAIVVIQEWWGINEQIRGVADRLASAGYVALVPDLYRGKSTVEAAE